MDVYINGEYIGWGEVWFATNRPDAAVHLPRRVNIPPLLNAIDIRIPIPSHRVLEKLTEVKPQEGTNAHTRARV